MAAAASPALPATTTTNSGSPRTTTASTPGEPRLQIGTVKWEVELTTHHYQRNTSGNASMQHHQQHRLATHVVQLISHCVRAMTKGRLCPAEYLDGSAMW